MAPVRNGRVIFNAYPEGKLANSTLLLNRSQPAEYPIPGETTVYDESAQIDTATVALNGGFLVKTLVLSIDPFLRNRMRDPQAKDPSRRGNSQGYKLGEPIDGFGVGVIVRSEVPDLPEGKHVYGFIRFPAFQEYTIFPPSAQLRIIEKHPDLQWSVYVGAAGMPGQTAYGGWKEHAGAKAGEVLFVTTGAGPVGSFVIQLAKQAGLKVIASAGTEEKLAFMKSIGADVVFNYKTTDTRAVLEKEGPVDIYWDNVGGDILDVTLENTAIYARILVRATAYYALFAVLTVIPQLCGAMSGYNTGYVPVKNLNMAYARSLSLYGVAVARLAPIYAERFYDEVPAKLASGEIKYTEEKSYGLDKVGDVLLAVQKGTNKAKAVIIVAEE
ncbi:NAD(P)-binding protein [Mycena indigotica]|uniref:NAD(P)-binding protein n=1 Tax=Mycena indigotica TaxID=2126181 RepID=A0A8H6S5C1_9AGAR|nr:NAD(P)-binding protein [Mycena indigotica]KAF7292628.1 NAD(P)-binding protein [Mycena indigotica]